MILLISVLCGAVVLLAYVVIEKRLSQKACAACGFNVSADPVNESCPRCEALINSLEID
jgi:rubrerythrin